MTTSQVPLTANIDGVGYVRKPSPSGGCVGCAGVTSPRICTRLPEGCHTTEALNTVWVEAGPDDGDPTDAHPV